MIKEFINRWEVNKNKLQEELSKGFITEYAELVKLVVKHIINAYTNDKHDTYNIDKMTVIDDGDYQGALIFIIPKNNYQPSVYDYIYASVNYGSCGCCDTLQRILDEENDTKTPTVNQIKDYMTLCMHLIQSFEYLDPPQIDLSDNHMTLYSFVARYTRSNTLIRLWYSANGCNRMLWHTNSDGTEVEVGMNWALLEDESWQSQYGDYKVLGVTDIVCDTYPEAVNIVIDYK